MSGVTAKSTNKIVLVLGIALVAVAGLFFFLRSGDSLTEEMVVNRAMEEMALIKPYMNMEAEAITANLDKREITFSKVRIGIPNVPEIEVLIDSIVETGIDAASYAGNYGDLTSIDVLSVNGVKILMQGQTLATIDEYVYEGFRINCRDILKLLRENQATAPEELAAKLLPLYATYSLDHALLKNMQLDVEGVKAGIASIEAKDITMTSGGPWNMSDMQISFLNQKVFSMEKMGGEGILLPQFLADLLADPEGYLQKNPEIINQASSDPLSVLAPMQIKGFYIDNLMINVASPLTLKKLAGDLDISQTGLVFKSSLEDLVISRSLLAMHPDLAAMAEAVTADLHLNGVFDFSLGNQADPVDITMRAGLNESSLGGLDANIAMDTPKDVLYSGGSDPARQRLKSFEFSAENKGIIDFIVACYAAVEFQDPDQIYGSLLDTLYAGLETAENKIQQDAFNAAIKLVEEGGTLKLSVKPATPISLKELSQSGGDAFESLGGSVSYTPLN
ncbi:MAG: hypothetical protein LBV80_03800 [Deltaproteobacteria bacterium]|jgi:hypothetical protein|nr:hypothetical protein [Deltaproteobacteria bacterium]